MFRVCPTSDTAWSYGLKYQTFYTVYAVNKNADNSTSFLFYINYEWKWMPASGFVSEKESDFYDKRS